MKRIILCVCALAFTSVCIASNPGAVEKMPARFVYKVTDDCFNQYYQLTQINEQEYERAVGSCYNVYQYPYNMLCHGDAIMFWSNIQDQIFDYYVLCQNGNLTKPKTSK